MKQMQNQSGRSMIEMLGVLAIIGVLSVGGIAGYSKAMIKYKTNKVADSVSTLVANIKTLYAQQNTYEGLSNETAISLGIIEPKGLGTTDIINAFNGRIDIEVSDSTSEGDNKAFLLKFDGLPSEACVTLATINWGSDASSGLIAIHPAVYGNAPDIEDKIGCKGRGYSAGIIACQGGEVFSIPMKVTDAAETCCKPGDTCSITWKYY